MNTIIIVLVSMLIYYSGLMYLSYSAFRKSKIKIGFVTMLFIPIFILKNYIMIAYKHKDNSKIRNHAILEFFFGYNTGLAILVEVVRFGFEKKYITSEKKERNGISTLITKVKDIFSNTLDEYLVY
ncbi:hypothetical protein ABVF54_10290 [Enterococcus mundtii]|uniref:Uncharacterized protein n=1 Tax=Enterococcus mundtii TaxID=53346 RepID=A0A848MVJ3_ENTMU|nr:hypothetical protein [Enterococcus mundtii]NMP57829.1 hypothetical protein [Enterococcus mundtii]BBM15598.1 uncharacterized protein EM151A_2417 [Enterococcus mundtii]